MSNPKRIQRRRSKGWRLPPNTVCVTRPGRWSNPYRLTGYQFENSDGTPAPHDELAARQMSLRDFEHALGCGLLPFTAEDARRELRGKNLACWCAPGKLCHADVLLRIANETGGDQ